MAAIRHLQIAAFTLLVALAAGKPLGAPIGPWKHSRGSRTAGAQSGFGDGKPLAEQCKERWRETRLDHFR
jgi:hypothetical protein